jgi:hypothetical protein
MKPNEAGTGTLLSPMIYADTSCLLKVLRPEPLSEAVWSAI